MCPGPLLQLRISHLFDVEVHAYPELYEVASGEELIHRDRRRPRNSFHAANRYALV